MWAWVITMRRSTGSNKVIASTTALISDLSASIRCLLHFTAIRDSKRSRRRLFRRGNSRVFEMKIGNFFAELKRRNVYKVAVAYAVVGWLLVQVATQVFPFFEIPNWVVRLLCSLIVIGFPIALVIAWAFELTPEGLKRTEDADLNRARTQEIARMDLRRHCRAHCSRSVCFLLVATARERTAAALIKSISVEIDCGSSVRKPERR